MKLGKKIKRNGIFHCSFNYSKTGRSSLDTGLFIHGSDSTFFQYTRCLVAAELIVRKFRLVKRKQPHRHPDKTKRFLQRLICFTKTNELCRLIKTTIFRSTPGLQSRKFVGWLFQQQRSGKSFSRQTLFPYLPFTYQFLKIFTSSSVVNIVNNKKIGDT